MGPSGMMMGGLGMGGSMPGYFPGNSMAATQLAQGRNIILYLCFCFSCVEQIYVDLEYLIINFIQT